MLQDGDYGDLGLPAITNSNTATASTNVVDEGAAKIVFGANKGPRLKGRAPVSVDCTGVRVDFVGSDAAALNSNNHVIASEYVTHDELGAALGTGTQNVEFDFEVNGQTVAKRYYGLLVTLVGTNPDMTAGDAGIVANPQTNMIGARAAVPA